MHLIECNIVFAKTEPNDNIIVYKSHKEDLYF